MQAKRALANLMALFAPLVAACGASSPPQPAPTASAAAGEVAPYPYTTSQIQDACHARVIHFRIEKAGAPATTERWVFADVDPDTTRITTTVLDADGKQVGDATVETPKWAELHEHARFPRAQTVLADESLTVEAGTFSATRYVVTNGDVVKTLWFAKGLAGPPVKMSVTRAGKPVLVMTMVKTAAQ